MLAGLPDPLGSGQMTFEVTIKPMPDDVDDNRNALSKTLYKYLYTIKMEHTGRSTISVDNNLYLM